MNRVMASDIWESEDISITDLSTPGAQNNNAWMNTFPDVYYFSHTAQSTYKSLITGRHLPHTRTTLIFIPSYIHGQVYTNKSS